MRRAAPSGWLVGGVLVAAALLAPLGVPALAAQGDLDPSFGTGGVVTTAFLRGAGANALVVQPDGKLLAAGYSGTDFALARYSADGALDTTFGPDRNGKVTTDIDGQDQVANALALQPADDKIVAAGKSCLGTGPLTCHFALTRYFASGDLDTTFGRSGKVTTDFGGSIAEAHAVAVQRDGKIVAAGYSCSNSCELALARYLTNGDLDTTFDGDGRVLTGVGGFDKLHGLVVLLDDKLLVAGHVRGTIDFALARYDTTGALEVLVSTNVNGDDYGNALVVQRTGKFVVAGAAEHTFALTRYTPDLLLDTTFGPNHDGSVITGFPYVAAANALVTQSDDKLVAAGYTTGCSSPGTCGFTLVRYSADGILDESFGANHDGTVVTNFPDGGRAFALALQPDGGLVAAGESGGNFVLVRYIGQAPPTSTPTPVTPSPVVSPSPTFTLTPGTVTPSPTITLTPSPSPDSTPLPRLVLPLLVRDPTPVVSSPVVANGDFEQGLQAWTAEAAPLPVGLATDQSRSPTHALLLGDPRFSARSVCESGGIPLGVARVSQRVQVPDRRDVSLTFWYRIFSQDKNITNQTFIDTLEVAIDGVRAFRTGYDEAQPATCETVRDLGWRQTGVALEKYRGQTVTLLFELWSREPTGDRGYYNTYAYLDDVRIAAP